MKEINRRDFLKLSLLSLGSLGCSSCIHIEMNSKVTFPSERDGGAWDMERMGTKYFWNAWHKGDKFNDDFCYGVEFPEEFKIHLCHPDLAEMKNSYSDFDKKKDIFVPATRIGNQIWPNRVELSKRVHEAALCIDKKDQLLDLNNSGKNRPSNWDIYRSRGFKYFLKAQNLFQELPKGFEHVVEIPNLKISYASLNYLRNMEGASPTRAGVASRKGEISRAYTSSREIKGYVYPNEFVLGHEVYNLARFSENKRAKNKGEVGKIFDVYRHLGLRKKKT